MDLNQQLLEEHRESAPAYYGESRPINDVEPLATEGAETDGKKHYWQPLEDRVLIRPASKIEQTKSGIWLPPQAQETQFQGVVVAHGPGRYDQGMLVPMTLKVGMTVIYGRHAGQHFKIDGVEVLMMRQGDIHAYMLSDESERVTGSHVLEFSSKAELTNGDE